MTCPVLALVTSVHTIDYCLPQVHIGPFTYLGRYMTAVYCLHDSCEGCKKKWGGGGGGVLHKCKAGLFKDQRLLYRLQLLHFYRMGLLCQWKKFTIYQ